MAPRKSKGILGDDTDPDKDADVIMTAAIVGYAARRLNAQKNCAFAAEVEQNPLVFPQPLSLNPSIVNYTKWSKEECEPKEQQYLAQVEQFQKDVIDIKRLHNIAKEDIAFTKGWILLDNAIERINCALQIPPQKEVPRVVVDASPNFGDAGVIWIVGGTGDLSLFNENRYINSPIRSNNCARKIYYIKSDKFAGYKGPGAYSGMSARQEGESHIYSTFRGHPVTDFGDRWLPSDPSILKMAIKNGNSPDKNVRYVSIWGIIYDNALADKTECDYQMVYLDPNQNGPQYEQYVVGYNHGMIQAVYDVKQAERNQEDRNELYSGTPYEIGLKGRTDKGPSTTKMASCFYCGLFMEANDKPASSIHLGFGESWAPAYSSKDVIEANKRINEDDKTYAGLDLQTSIDSCNRKWAALCSDVLKTGCDIIQPKMLADDDHVASFTALQEFLRRNVDVRYAAANLILDSATVHQKICVRVVSTLKPPDVKK